MSEELKKQEELGHRHGEGCGCHNDHHGEEAGRRVTTIITGRLESAMSTITIMRAMNFHQSAYILMT